MPKGKEQLGAKSAGRTFGNVSNAATIAGQEKFNATRGHGFAGERAGHLCDTLTGHETALAGDSNVKNGADRIVDGVTIQSKFCATGSRCIQNCFENDTFRYINTDGTPMKIEVPFDKYDDAVKAMAHRIEQGQVPGVNAATNEEAKKAAEGIVQKSPFTYEQVKNIAKFGTVESLTYDAVNGII